MSLSRTPGGHATGPLAARFAVVIVLVVSGLAGTVTGALPARATAGGQRDGVPTVVLCGGYRGCNRTGYDSYGYGRHASRSYWRMYPGDECTNYVAYVEATYFGVATPGYLLGNADQWPASAAAHGVTVNNVPSVGAVAVWTGGAYGMGPEGHVAVVERVGPHDSSIVISQQHLLGVPNGYEWTRINAGYPAHTWEPWPNRFIHFRVRTTIAIPPARGRRDRGMRGRRPSRRQHRRRSRTARRRRSAGSRRPRHHPSLRHRARRHPASHRGPRRDLTSRTATAAAGGLLSLL